MIPLPTIAYKLFHFVNSVCKSDSMPVWLLIEFKGLKKELRKMKTDLRLKISEFTKPLEVQKSILSDT